MTFRTNEDRAFKPKTVKFRFFEEDRVFANPEKLERSRRIPLNIFDFETTENEIALARDKGRQAILAAFNVPRCKATHKLRSTGRIQTPRLPPLSSDIDGSSA